MNTNTKITYMYRDASNYKKYNGIIVSGMMSDEQLSEITKSLQDLTYFIPEEIGLPCERFENITEDDHPFCEFIDSELTEASATLDIDVATLVQRFIKAGRLGWKEGSRLYPPIQFTKDDTEETLSAKKKFCVIVTRTGCVFVKAENESQAMWLADHQTTENVSWSDDWEPTDVEEDDSYQGEYITTPAFK